MAYVKTSMGPGDIAALPPTVGLTNKPTIGANDMPRTIRGMSPSPYAPPPLNGCHGCGVGTEGESSMTGFLKLMLIPVVVGAGLYMVFRPKEPAF